METRDDDARQQVAAGEAEATDNESGKVEVGFDFHVTTTRLSKKRLWLSVLTFGGAVGLLLTVLQMLSSWLKSIFK